MNMQQVVLPKTSANGFGRRRGDREVGTRLENKMQSGKSNQGRIQTTGIILKMARLIKDGTLRGHKATAEFVSKAPSKILIIPAKELVQVIAKDVAITRDGFASELQHEKHQEILIDSVISQSRHVELERQLEPWVPDENDPQCPELENTFDSPWNRNWDQFETNQTLFGVQSTFNEELYTTKLERGPQMRELEKKAIRIAREIEGEDTQDLHLAEERGIDLHDNVDIDEEMRFSSVYRGRGVEDSGYEEDEDIMLDSHNIETFGNSSDSLSGRPADLTSSQSSDGVRMPSSASLMDEAPSSQAAIVADLNRSGFNDEARQLASELPSKNFCVSDSESRIQDSLLGEHGGSIDAKEFAEKQHPSDDVQLSYSVDSQSLLNDKVDGSDKAGPSANPTTHAPSNSLSKVSENQSPSGELLEGPASSKSTGEAHFVNSRGRPASSTSSNSDCVGAVLASSGPGLSPSSSMGSLSSEKSTLNPHAKEFKLNPNAKCFTPSQMPVRSPSPVSDGSFYYQAQMSPGPQMHMPVSFGIAPPFPGPQPVIFNPQVAPIQSPQAYFHPNGPQYGQPMLFGQRPVVYYQPEMQYKGRDY
ncbi:polyadenylate-binding protein-interacting protein 3-like isoform X2 [Durio zibethinus]|uniref:Polyadenylate-binding protein-interacting protein 3-like isoform X2 n=1 Tax=Durio zibethinus TaxID=66656 RepID=A0A6P5WH25_DURZI|nr:polyadenylate-binding protein-interacting protein 3-like isoform X2 [Durio zibethinus]